MAINVLGLALGLACCVLLVLYVRSEVAVNRDVPDAEHIYRLGSEWAEGTAGLPFTAPAAAGPELVEAFSEVEASVRVWAGWLNMRSDVTGTEAPEVFRRNAYIADSNALDVFGFELLYGDAVTALREPRSIVLHERVAESVFGTSDAVGQTLIVETYNRGEQPHTVTGVWTERPVNSFTHFNGESFEVITSFTPGDMLAEEDWDSWENRYLLVYLKLASGADVASLRARLPAFVSEHAPEEWGGSYAARLQPFSSLYLDGFEGKNRKAVYVLSALALLILLVACINFTNLATARALDRSREVGVRKAVGAPRTQLVRLFLGEALLVAGIATTLGAGLARVLQEPFFDLVDKPLTLPEAWDATMGLALIGIALVTGLLAGTYPAFVLSAFRPVRVLRGTPEGSGGGGWLRRTLVVTQFAATVALVAGAVIVQQQTAFLDRANLGFEREHVLAIRSVPRDWSPEGVERLQPIKERLEAVPGVRAVSLSWETASEGADNTLPVRRADQPDDQALDLSRFVVDANYDDVYGLDLVAGSFFPPEAAATGVLLNERAASVLGVSEPGELLVLDGDETVLRGIVRDFHFESLHREIRPLVLAPVDQIPYYRTFSLRLAGGNEAETLAAVQEAWAHALPTAPFEYSFVDDDVAAQYATERRTGSVVGLAAGLAIVVALLGLLGLVSLTMRQRRREIAVRKVLGATVLDIVTLFVKSIGVLVAAAVALAAPLTHLAAEHWLDAFAYRIDLGAGPLVFAGLLALSITLLTVGTQAFRAAMADPVRALRSE